MDNPKRINVALDESLHRQIKIASAIKGISIKEYVTAAVKEHMAKDNNPDERGNHNAG